MTDDTIDLLYLPHLRKRNEIYRERTRKYKQDETKKTRDKAKVKQAGTAQVGAISKAQKCKVFKIVEGRRLFSVSPPTTKFFLKN